MSEESFEAFNGPSAALSRINTSDAYTGHRVSKEMRTHLARAMWKAARRFVIDAGGIANTGPKKEPLTRCRDAVSQDPREFPPLS